MKASPVPASLGKHRRRASTSPFTLPDQDDFGRPLDRDMPKPAPTSVASPLRLQANQLSTGHIAASAAANDTSATSAQESLQKATIALKGLQTKYGRASSRAHSSSDSFLGIISQEIPTGISSTADTEADKSPLESPAAPSSSRSSFSFQSAVGVRAAARLPGGDRPGSSGGAHPSVSGGPHPSSPGGAHPNGLGEAHPSTSGGFHPCGDPQPCSSRQFQSSSSADESSHAGSTATDYLMLCLQTGTLASTVSFTAMACSKTCRLQS